MSMATATILIPLSKATKSSDLLGSSILIAPLVFFISPNEPRFLKTIRPNYTRT
ncbi:hypothetical protein BJ875DRAFT_480182 [Amylocarpus encephaloides]|uniref:Uncharacterized protein n=1 Tax=Amylocarpus encephaloides TaxID=45428 RepID=A0A9P7YSM8_9HELO|nr:hypothetical protein BJ875DRAFT_480182 [Amylocarpus encephaloides]